MNGWDSIRRRFASDRLARAFAMFFATSLAARGVSIVCQLLQVPLVVSALGGESFGLWMTMTSLTSLVLFADFGLGLGAQNRLAELFARDRRDEARRLLGGVFLVLALLGILLGVACTWLVPRLDFTALFRLHETAAISEAPSAALAVGWVFCAGFPCGLGQRLAFARQEGWRYNVTQAAGNLLALCAVAAGVAAGWRFAALAVVAQGSVLAGNALLLASQLRQLGWLRGWRLRPPLRELADLLRVGACFSVQQLLTTVLFSLPQVIISTRLGAAAVTPYNLVQRLFNLFAVVQNAFMLPLWPAYSRAKARNEFGWIRRNLRRSLWATAFASVLPMVAGAGFVPVLIRWWVGPAAPRPDLSLVWLLCAWNAVVFLQQPFSYMLAGVSELRRTTFYSVLGGAGSTVLMCLLAPTRGADGVVLGLLAGYLPFCLLGFMHEARRYLNGVPVPAGRPAPQAP